MNIDRYEDWLICTVEFKVFVFMIISEMLSGLHSQHTQREEVFNIQDFD